MYENCIYFVSYLKMLIALRTNKYINKLIRITELVRIPLCISSSSFSSGGMYPSLLVLFEITEYNECCRRMSVTTGPDTVKKKIITMVMEYFYD